MNRLIDIIHGATLAAVVVSVLIGTKVIEVRVLGNLPLAEPRPVNHLFTPCEWPPRPQLDRGPPPEPKLFPFSESH